MMTGFLAMILNTTNSVEGRPITGHKRIFVGDAIMGVCASPIIDDQLESAAQ